MDYLELICKTEEKFQKQTQVITSFSDDNDMEFGLEICAKTVLRKEN
jgi:hypothetical protein